MIIKKLKLKNVTVFADQEMEFSPGVNIFIGENGTGKTHIMKILYSACQSVQQNTSFLHKLVMTMLPDDYKISRLVTRKPGNQSALIRIEAGEPGRSDAKTLSANFSLKTKRWDADVKGERGWESTFKGLSSIFIPAKEILSHSCNLNAAAGKNNVRFDDTYLDIINAAKVDVSVGQNNSVKDKMLKRIQQIAGGKVVYDGQRDEFYLRIGNSHQEFNLVAEGIRKMGLLWQLVKNGTLEKGSILFWDEPEANINPSYISTIVELLLELHRRGVQIFVSTHDYMISSYFDVKKRKGDSVTYHSLSKDQKGPGMLYSKSERFDDLENNAIISAFNRLLDEIYKA